MPKAKRYEFLRRLGHQRAAVIGATIIASLALMGIFAPLITPYNPVKQDLVKVLVPPSSAHPLGTDHLGRDILSRIFYGARLSLFIGFLAVGLGLAIGVPLGIVSGYYGGWVDIAIQRLVDIMLSFPSFLLALSLVALLGVGLSNVILAVGVSTIPSFIRLARGTVLVVREQTYIEAAKAVGTGDTRILFRHILPNVTAPVIVQATLGLGMAILMASGLGFLGLGVQPPTPEWGSMLGEGRNYIFSAPHVATFPGIAIFLAVLGFNLLGDGLRDALDPYLRLA